MQDITPALQTEIIFETTDPTVLHEIMVIFPVF